MVHNTKQRHGRIDWPEELDRLLGELSDLALSKRFGIALSSIRSRRVKFGIPGTTGRRTGAAAPQFDWTEETDSLLGTAPDTTLARRLGVTPATVRYRREKLGVGPFVPPPLPPTDPAGDPYEWSDETDALLGTMHDTLLAKRLGVNHSTVTYRRMELGVQPFRRSARIEWTAKMLEQLGQMADIRFSEKFDIAANSVKLKRLELRIPAYGKDVPDPLPVLPATVISLLGKLSDTELARRFSLRTLDIRMYRVASGIEPAERPRHSKHQWVLAEEQLLGTRCDADVARKLDIPLPQIRHRRKILGIPPADRRNSVHWTKKRLGRLGLEADHVLAKEWKCTQALVREKRELLGIEQSARSRQWSEAEIDLLGTLSDKALGDRLGVSASAVGQKRRELSISPCKPVKPIRWSKMLLARLGEVSDHQLAFEMGVHPSAVEKKRKQLGLPSFRERRLQTI